MGNRPTPKTALRQKASPANPKVRHTSTEARFTGLATGDTGRKSLTLPMHTKVLEEAQGICEHVVSVFGVVDYGGDRILPGFFAKSLAAKKPKGVWCHDWTIPVAKTLEAEELLPGDERLPEEIREFGGLYVKAQYNLDTQRGREAFSDVSGGFMDEFSIGFTVTQEALDKKTGVNNLIEGRLFEWSPVLWGMNPLTQHISAKSDTATKSDTSTTKTGTSATPAPATDAEDLSLLVKGGDSAWQALREKSMDDELPAAMTWGALYTANNYLYYELYDAVWGWGEYRDADIETRALMLAECIDSFKSMVLGTFVSLMTLLSQMDEAEDATEEEDGITLGTLSAEELVALSGVDSTGTKSDALRARVTLSLLKRLGPDLSERALSRLLAEGQKGLSVTLKTAIQTPVPTGNGGTPAVGGVPTAPPSTKTETPADLEEARVRAAQALALTR